MGISYLAPHFESCIVGQVGNSTMSKEAVKLLWFSQFGSNGSSVIPSSAVTAAEKQYYELRGFALRSAMTTTESPPGGPLYSVMGSKPLPTSFGKRWKQRHKSGEILLTNWSSFEARVERASRPSKSLTDNTETAFRGYWFYDMSGNYLAGAALTNAIIKGVPFYSIYLAYRFQQVTSYSYLDPLVDNDVLAFILEPPRDVDDGIITSALADANNGYFDVLTELMELPETLKWAYDLIGQAQKATAAAKAKEIKLHRNFKRKLMTAVEFATALSSVWLQYRYAIKPLAYSLADIQEVLMFYKHLFKTSRNYKTVDDEWINSVKDRAAMYGLKVEYSIDESKFRVFIKRRYNAESVLQDRLRNFTVNPFATAWELVPLSFIADWFVNIGDVLAAGTSMVAYAQEAATASWKYQGSFSFEKIDDPGPTIDVSYKMYERLIINPSAHIELNWDPYIDTVRQLDALALSWSFSKNEWSKLILRK